MILLRKIGLIFTALLLVVATGGYSIYQHYCQCAEDRSVTVFVEPVCEHESEQTASSCCAAETSAKACCAAEEKTNQHNCQDDNCCKDSSVFLKISDFFKVSFEKVSFQVVRGVIQLFIGISDAGTTGIGKTAFADTSDIPPPVYGVDLLHKIHQLKIAPALS